MDDFLNRDIVGNPANWAIIFTMIVIGAMAYHLVIGAGEK